MLAGFCLEVQEERTLVTIYLTRHGETVWNKEGRLQGTKNSALTENGVKNATLLGERLRNVPFEKIYSSSSQRAFTTAELINQGRDIFIEKVDSLTEISFGDWEGLTQEEIENDYPEQYVNFWSFPHEYDHQGHKAESFLDFKLRVEKAMKEILNKHEKGNILIVTHGVVITAIMSFFWKIPLEKMWDQPVIHGTSLSVITWDGVEFQKQLLGDISHITK